VSQKAPPEGRIAVTIQVNQGFAASAFCGFLGWWLWPIPGHEFELALKFFCIIVICAGINRLWRTLRLAHTQWRKEVAVYEKKNAGRPEKSDELLSADKLRKSGLIK